MMNKKELQNRIERLERLEKMYLTEIKFLRKKLDRFRPFKCICCGREINPLEQACALVFGPPCADGLTVKDHLCVSCYEVWKNEMLRK